MDRIAQCHCGSLKAIVSDPLDRVYLCHCKACQRRTGSIVHAGAYYPKEQVKAEGPANVWEREVEGRKLQFYFCPTCGTSVYWDAAHSPAMRGVAVGCFADPTYFPPLYSIFEESMHPWFPAQYCVGAHRYDQKPGALRPRYKGT